MISALDVSNLLQYEPQTGVFTWRVRSGCCAAGHTAGTVNGKGYRQIRLNGRIYLAHRLAWLMSYGELPAQDVDHINGDKQDNRLCNLRAATRQQNLANQKRRRTSTTCKGVTRHKSGRFKARLMIQGKEIHLGYFATEEQAHAAYIAAAQKEFGAFARAE